jgi:hypothetical protein
MVRISEHRKQHTHLIQRANIQVVKTKYNFSPIFSEKVYDFSEKNHREHFKVFNERFERWSAENKRVIEEEIARITSAGFCGSPDEVLQKIKVSARFYYRKKSKKEAKHKEVINGGPKPYVGLSSEFIQRMDEFITGMLLKGAGAVVKKRMFTEFTFTHVNEIEVEVGRLKEKYDAYGYVFVPLDIAKKFKKSFDNRWYVYYNMNTTT